MNPRDSVEVMETQADDPKEKLIGNETEGEDDKVPGAYNCNICGRSFPFLSSLSQHMRRHTGARPYKCPYCDHRASQKGNLKVHIRSHKLGTLSSHHTNEDEDCGPDEEEMKVSEGLDGGTSPTKSSSACNKVVNGDPGEENRRKVPARSLKRDKSVTNQRPYCCRLCGYEAQREDQLLSHIEKVHITVDTEEDSFVVKEEALTEADAVQPQSDGTFPCETCGQVFSQAWFLKSHMKKHAGILDHCCRICGRRFREAWFLKSHMKTHNTRSRSRSKADLMEHPATINDVAQDADIVFGSVTSVYQTCSKCGNLFFNRESLKIHEKVHNSSYGRKSPVHDRPVGEEDSPAAKRLFLDYLNLRSVKVVEENSEKSLLGQRIAELDPVCSYQAWQLATKGRVVEPIESNLKYCNGGGNMSEGGMARNSGDLEKESNQYNLQGHEKRSSSRRGSSGFGAQNSPEDWTAESLSDSEYQPSSRQDKRRPSQSHASSKTNECFECGKMFRSRHQMIVHQRVHKKDAGRTLMGDKVKNTRDDQWASASDPESGSPSRSSTPGYADSSPTSNVGSQGSDMGTSIYDESIDKKPHTCGLCDFASVELQSYLNHVRLQHPAASKENLGPSSGLDTGGHHPKLKTPFIPEINHTSSPHAFTSNSPPELDPTVIPVDLCVRAEGVRGIAAIASNPKSLPSHKCSLCSHSTRYPEVLWMHQTVSHRISSSSSNIAPKWAVRDNSKGSRDDAQSVRRRTGPPPALEGKDCQQHPSLGHTWRTQPPIGNSEILRKRSSGHSAATSSSPSPCPTSSSSSRGSLVSSSSQRGRVPAHSVSNANSKLTAEQSHRFHPKADTYPRGASLPVEKSSAGLSRYSTSSPSSAVASRMAGRPSMPPEGLGFMLSSKHGLAEYHRARVPPQQPLPNSHSQSRAARPSTVPHGYSVVHRAAPQTSTPPSSTTQMDIRGSVQQESTVDNTDMPTDVLGFLKSYSPHELAALYHRWGAAGTMMDPSGVMRSFMRQGQYSCNECGKSFGQPSHLRTHMRSHTGERPYCCRLCPYRASQKGNLKTHVQSVHHLPFDNSQYLDSKITLLDHSEQEGAPDPQETLKPQ